MSKTKAKPENTLMLGLDKSGQYVDVQWTVDDAESDWDRYSVSLTELTERSEEVRKQLAELQACSWSDSEEAMDRRILRLQNLARAGTKLYETLMEGDASDRPSVRAANAFREWFEKTVLKAPHEWRIQVVHQQYDAPVVPWGLVFTPLQDKSIKDLGEGVDDYMNFWALCFKLACRGPNRRAADQQFTERDQIQARLALTVKVEEELLKQYGEGKTGDKEDVRQRVSTSIETFEKFPRESGGFDIFWYIFLNEGGPGYRLGDGEIDDSLIDDVKKKTENVMIMFLDGTPLFGAIAE